MSRRTQLTTKFIFQVLSQLSENFIFVYLGLSLFTERGLDFRPLFIIVAVIGICVARGLAIFPLSKAINWFIRWRARRFGAEPEELTFPEQCMLFWAGLRGAVGVALAAGLTGANTYALRATVLIVVVLTVIIFGGTTARMLEILGIRTGVQEEVDSDDEFDIEVVSNGHYRGKNGQSFGHNPKDSSNGSVMNLSHLDSRTRSGHKYSTGSVHGTPPERLDSSGTLVRKNSMKNVANAGDIASQHAGLLDPDEFEDDDLDLPPAARRTMHSAQSPRHADSNRGTSAPPAANHSRASSEQFTGFRQFLSGSTDDPAQWFRQIDEDFIKPKLLLDPSDGSGRNPPPGPGNV